MKKENKYLKKFIDSLNGKTFNELDDAMQNLINSLFHETDLDHVYEAVQLYGEQANVKITFNGVEKFILLRKPDETTIKCIQMNDLVEDLTNIGIDKDTMNFIKFYQYGDSSVDGSGSKKMTNEELKFKFEKEIAFYNEILNNDLILPQLVDYFIFGNREDKTHNVHMVVYAGDHYFTFATREEVVLYNIQNKCLYLRNLHVGNLLIGPFTRKPLEDNEKNLKDLVAIRWYNYGTCVSQIHFSRYFDKQNIKRNYEEEELMN